MSFHPHISNPIPYQINTQRSKRESAFASWGINCSFSPISLRSGHLEFWEGMGMFWGFLRRSLESRGGNGSYGGQAERAASQGTPYLLRGWEHGPPKAGEGGLGCLVLGRLRSSPASPVTYLSHQQKLPQRTKARMRPGYLPPACVQPVRQSPRLLLFLLPVRHSH